VVLASIPGANGEELLLPVFKLGLNSPKTVGPMTFTATQTQPQPNNFSNTATVHEGFNKWLAVSPAAKKLPSYYSRVRLLQSFPSRSKPSSSCSSSSSDTVTWDPQSCPLSQTIIPGSLEMCHITHTNESSTLALMATCMRLVQDADFYLWLAAR
jgi:hypothetical protein